MKDVKFDFQAANSQINELEEIAAKLEKIASKECGESIRTLGNAWKGAGAEGILLKAGLLQDKIAETANLAEETAEEYRSAKQKARTVEQSIYAKLQND